MMEYQFHDFANLFPLIEGEEFLALVDDIRAHGVREPIWLYEGKILDGRNRYRAAIDAGAEFDTREYEGNKPLEHVVSLNLHRRHLNESQRAMVAVKLETMRHGDNQHTKGDANLHVLREDAAKLLNVSPRTVATAASVQRHATPELQRAVEQGKVAVSAAAQAAKFMPPEQQRQAVVDGSIARAVAEYRRAEARFKEIEKVVAEAPKFTSEQAGRLKEVIGSREDGEIYSRIDEVVQMLKEQPSPDEAAERIPLGLRHAIDTTEIHAAAKWLLDFCTAWTVANQVPAFVPEFLTKEAINA